MHVDSLYRGFVTCGFPISGVLLPMRVSYIGGDLFNAGSLYRRFVICGFVVDLEVCYIRVSYNESLVKLEGSLFGSALHQDVRYMRLRYVWRLIISRSSL